MLKFTVFPLLCAISLCAAPEALPEKTKKLPGIEVKLDSMLMKDVYKGVLLKSNTQELKIDSKVWKKWEVKSVASHGQLVKKGEVLLRFDREDYDKELKKKTRSFDLAKLAYEKNIFLSKIAKEKIEQGRALTLLKFKKAKLAQELYVKTGKALKLQAQVNSVENMKNRLALTKSELQELEAMYKSDEIYEKTEEMVIKRQRDAVKIMEYHVKNSEYKYDLFLNVKEPQSELIYEHKRKNFSSDEKAAQLSYQEQLKKHASSLASLEENFIAKKEAFEDFKKDAEFFVLKADRDGQLIYGSENKGKWHNPYGEEIKEETSMRVGSSPMTVVAGKSMRVTVQIPYVKKETLADKASFVAFPHGAEVRAARFISSVATPVKGMIAAEFEVDNSDDLYQGIPVEIHLLRKKEELIVLSVKSIQRDELKPWETYVNVSKDGESVKTPVVLGESYGGKVVIKSGLSVKDRVL